ncbi:MAG: ABC transporter permease [Thermomicrobiales bacterium]|nr:ABC transporter permease [Thermomicrobiales bacterium]
MATSSRQRPPGFPRPPAWLLLVAPATIFLALLFVLPGLRILSFSVMQERPSAGESPVWTLDHYEKLFTQPLYRSIMTRTFKIAFMVTIVNLLVSYPIALGIVRIRNSWIRAFLVFAVISPLLTSIIVRTYGWMVILSDRGPVNRFMMWLGVIDEPYRMLYNELGVTIALVQVFVPFMVLSLVSAIQTIDPSLEQAAASLRANRLQTFLKVTLPLSAPGIVTGSVLVFILTLGSFVTPVLLGSARTMMAAVLIRDQILGLFVWSFPAAVTTVLLVATLVLLLIYGRIVRRWSM